MIIQKQDWVVSEVTSQKRHNPTPTTPTDILSSHQDYYYHYYPRPESELRGDKVK